MPNDLTGYRWVKIHNGMGLVGIVSLTVIPNTFNRSDIIELYQSKNSSNNNDVDSAPTYSPASWKLGARCGLDYAFSLVQGYWRVELLKIEGLITGTNPTIVGYTTIRAFFDAINSDLDQCNVTKLERFVEESSMKPMKEFIPDFFTRTFSEFNANER